MKINQLQINIGGEEITISGDSEIDLGVLDLKEQRDAFQELLETTPDKDLADVFEQFASQELMDKLKDHFMTQYGLVEEEENDQS